MGAGAEHQLLDKCRKGDAEAWDQLFDLHYGAAARFVYQLGYDLTREDVEEVCQEVFLTVIKSLENFRENCQFQTWLFRIAANRARDFRQRQHAAKRGGGQTVVPLQIEDPETGYRLDPPSQAPGPDTLLLHAEQSELLMGALGQLGEPCREIIQLRYFGDLSYEEIASSLRLNPKTVSSRLSKCLDKLEAVARALVLREKKAPTSV